MNCTRCGASLATETLEQFCPRCVSQMGIAKGLPAGMRRSFGVEYKSSAAIFGVPLIHVAFGTDPTTGKHRIAKGIIAVGDIAIGVIATGGIAMGGFTFGGLTAGVVSVGGLAFGLLLAIGGCVLGGIAIGGFAAGGIAVGGIGVGYYAAGGAGLARFGLFASRHDPEALALFGAVIDNWRRWVTILAIAVPVIGSAFSAFVWLVFYFSPRKS